MMHARSIFVGSANMDWRCAHALTPKLQPPTPFNSCVRSLAQVKELGALLSSCPPVALDLTATFESYCAYP